MKSNEDTTTDNVAKNMLDKLDVLADAYRKNKSTQALINFIQFRDDFLKLEADLSLTKLINFNTGWNMMVYCGVVTDELEIFDNGKSVQDPKFVQEIKTWRRDYK